MKRALFGTLALLLVVPGMGFAGKPDKDKSKDKHGKTEEVQVNGFNSDERGRVQVFFTVDNNHHGSGHVAIWCRAEPGMQGDLVDAEPRHFFVPPYVGGQGWLGVRLDTGLDWNTVTALIERAWREVAPKKLVAARPLA